MTEVTLMGLLRLSCGKNILTVEARTVGELVIAVNSQCPELSVKELKRSVIFVGDKNITNLKMFRTRLKDNDKVIIMSPVSGG